jgi:hypothetical protein
MLLPSRREAALVVVRLTEAGCRTAVMPTEVGIHVFPVLLPAKTWMAGLRPP